MGMTEEPSAAEGLRLTDLASELADVVARIAQLDEERKKLVARRTQLEQRELPDYMNAIGQDRIGLPDRGVDIELREFYKAAIPKDWPAEKQEEAFDWLVAAGHGDVLKITVAAELGRNQGNVARDLEETMRERGITPKRTRGVHWATLTALVRELVEKGQEVPLDLLGAEVGTYARVKERD